MNDSVKKMPSIKLQKTLSTPISLRLNNELLEKIDGVVASLKEHYSEVSVSRSQLIELLLDFACENASLEFDGRVTMFSELYDSFKETK